MRARNAMIDLIHQGLSATGSCLWSSRCPSCRPSSPDSPASSDPFCRGSDIPHRTQSLHHLPTAPPYVPLPDTPTRPIVVLLFSLHRPHPTVLTHRPHPPFSPTVLTPPSSPYRPHPTILDPITASTPILPFPIVVADDPLSSLTEDLPHPRIPNC